MITILENKLAYETRHTLIDRILRMPGVFFNNVDNGELYIILYGDEEKIPIFLINTV